MHICLSTAVSNEAIICMSNSSVPFAGITSASPLIWNGDTINTTTWMRFSGTPGQGLNPSLKKHKLIHGNTHKAAQRGS